MTEINAEQRESTLFPIVVIPSEIMTFLTNSFDASHGLAGYLKFITSPPEKVSSSVSLFSFQFIESIFPDIKEEHPENAPSSIVVTLLGMVIEIREEQSENAWTQISVIPSLITIRLIFFFIRAHGTVVGSIQPQPKFFGFSHPQFSLPVPSMVKIPL